MKKTISFSLLLTTLAFSSIGFAQKSAKPNVLFIAIDDLKPDMGCYGNKMVKTPNIDRLAKMGTVFMNNYVQQAVCGPTRASLMTGKRPDYTKVWDLKTKMRDINPNILTIPQYFASQGYSSQGIGKVYDSRCVDKKMDEPSWSVPYYNYFKTEERYYAKETGMPVSGAYQSPETKVLVAKFRKEAEDKGMNEKDADDYVSKKIKPSVECVDVPDNAYNDGANVVRAIEILEKLKSETKPFFFAVGFSKPHLPFVAPKKYWDLYNREDMQLAAFREHANNAPELAYHKSGELRNYIDIPAFATFNQPGNHVYLKEEKQKELIHGYMAAVSYTDAQIGILLNTLDSLGTLNNTIIVLWGDHGWHLGDHDLWEKHTNLENATRAPLIIAAPGLKAGKSASLSEHVDIFPTICDLANVGVPTQLQGKSLKPIMQNNKASVKDFSVSQYPRKLSKEDMKKFGTESNKIMGYSMRTEKYRYTIWVNDFTTADVFSDKKIYAQEMYDYSKDPLEKENIFSNASYAKAAQDMHQKMLSFFASQVKK